MIRDSGRTTGRFIKNHPAIVFAARENRRDYPRSDIRILALMLRILQWTKI